VVTVDVEALFRANRSDQPTEAWPQAHGIAIRAILKKSRERVDDCGETSYFGDDNSN
jgi:hypothetical protein